MQESKTHLNAFHIKFPTIKRYITEADVVCCTFEGVLTEYLSGFTFPRIIVDDCSSSFEVSALAGFTKNCQQAVLFGDHKLLPPGSRSDLAVSKGLKMSLFERLTMQGYPTSFLNTQYLINPNISYFPSLKFYGARLKSGIDVETTPLIPGFDWPRDQVGMALINVEDSHEEYWNQSLQNTREAEVVMKIVTKILTGGYCS